MIETKSPEIGLLYQNLKDVEAALSEPIEAGDLAQEILDFLAMAAGLKSVFLLGRGVELLEWIAGARDLAGKFGFYVMQGPFWDATPFGKFPDWYRDYTVTQLVPFRATYICSSRETAQEIGSIKDSGGRLSMMVEARLLGYPECCVVAHYDRVVSYHHAIFSILKRLAGGDEAQMQALLRGGAALAPKTKREIAHMEAAFELHPAPYGSWNQCPHCARNEESLSAELSRIFRSLAETTDAEWSQELR